MKWKLFDPSIYLSSSPNDKTQEISQNIHKYNQQINKCNKILYSCKICLIPFMDLFGIKQIFYFSIIYV